VVIYGDVCEDEGGRDVVRLGFDGGDDYLWLYSVETGTMDADKLWFEADMDWEYMDMSFADCYYILAALGEAPITVSRGTKWSFEKVPSVKFVKYREDGETWYGLTGFEDDSKPNVCGLNLSYMAKTGMFKGSYYIYLTDWECVDEREKPKLKKLKVSVTGIVNAYGEGDGCATLKYNHEIYSWPVYIYPSEEEECPQCGY